MTRKEFGIKLRAVNTDEPDDKKVVGGFFRLFFEAGAAGASWDEIWAETLKYADEMGDEPEEFALRIIDEPEPFCTFIDEPEGGVD